MVWATESWLWSAASFRPESASVIYGCAGAHGVACVLVFVVVLFDKRHLQHDRPALPSAMLQGTFPAFATVHCEPLDTDALCLNQDGFGHVINPAVDVRAAHQLSVENTGFGPVDQVGDAHAFRAVV